MKNYLVTLLFGWILSIGSIAASECCIDSNVSGVESSNKENTLQLSEKEIEKRLIGTWREIHHIYAEDILKTLIFGENIVEFVEDGTVKHDGRDDLYVLWHDEDLEMDAGGSLWFEHEVISAWKIEEGKLITDRKEEVLRGVDNHTRAVLELDFMVRLRAEAPTEIVYEIIEITDTYYNMLNIVLSDSGEKIGEFWSEAWKVEGELEKPDYASIPRTVADDLRDYWFQGEFKPEVKFIGLSELGFWYGLYTPEEFKRFFNEDEEEEAISLYFFYIQEHEQGWLVEVVSINEEPVTQTWIWQKKPESTERIIRLTENEED